MGHERRFPEGTLSEEREFLIISAMRQRGREEQAAKRLEAFRSQYPESVYLEKLDVP